MMRIWRRRMRLRRRLSSVYVRRNTNSRRLTKHRMTTRSMAKYHRVTQNKRTTPETKHPRNVIFKQQKTSFGLVNPGNSKRQRHESKIHHVVTEYKTSQPSPDIGVFYKNKLQVVADTSDLFDKVLRSHIVGNYVLKYDTNYYNELKQHPDTSNELKLPPDVGNLFVISIRSERLVHFKRRMGPWEKHVTFWPGIVGAELDKNQLLRDGVLTNYEFRKGEPNLRRGEIGCYLAHYTLWQHIVKHKIPNAMIMEDDADICYSSHIVDRLTKMFSDIKRFNLCPDVVYLGHNDYFTPTTRFPDTELVLPGECQGTFTYWAPLSGIQKLVDICMPIGPPVDIRMFAERQRLKQFSLEPRLNWVVPVWSDTNNVW